MLGSDYDCLLPKRSGDGGPEQSERKQTWKFEDVNHHCSYEQYLSRSENEAFFTTTMMINISSFFNLQSKSRLDSRCPRFVHFLFIPCWTTICHEHLTQWKARFSLLRDTDITLWGWRSPGNEVDIHDREVINFVSRAPALQIAWKSPGNEVGGVGAGGNCF